MPGKDNHHATKKRRYSLILIPSGDAGNSRSLQFAPWQFGLGVLGAVLLVVVVMVLLLAYTPIGMIVRIPNPELENRYGRELVAMNEKMEMLMQQLVEVRAYNLKLRRAFGETVSPADTSLATLRLRTPSRAQEAAASREEPVRREAPSFAAIHPSVSVALATVSAPEESQRVAFPAIVPTEGYVTQGFDPGRRHYGLDIAGKTGTIVNAAADGYVVFAGWTQSDGYVMILSHPGGFLTFYKHNQALLKSANSYVRRGEPIALLGNSGQTSQGPHLHFEIWKDGTPVDPAQYLLNLNS